MELLFGLFVAIIICLLIWMYVNYPWKKNDYTSPNQTAPKVTATVLEFSSPVIERQKIAVPVKEIDFNSAQNLWMQSVRTDFEKLESLSELLSKKQIDDIFYGDLLGVVQWRYKRLTILIRDGFVCEDCKTRNVKNHVHHKFYLQDKLPWDIEDDALTTLCASCHSLRHQREIINVYRLDKGQRILTSLTSKYCYRCNGAGYLPKYQHVENGICFKCRGDCVNRNIFKKAIGEYQTRVMNSSHTPIRLEYGRFLRTISMDTFIAKIYPVIEMSKFDNANYQHLNLDNCGADEDLPF